MSDAVFQGTFASVRPVAGRKVWQFVIEVPAEKADAALKAMGGLPNPEESRWVAVARLNPKATGEAPAEGATAPKIEKSLARRARERCVILCGDARFADWLGNRVKHPIEEEHTAAKVVRSLIKVKSRSEIETDGGAFQRWLQLEREFMDHQRYGDRP